MIAFNFIFSRSYFQTWQNILWNDAVPAFLYICRHHDVTQSHNAISCTFCHSCFPFRMVYCLNILYSLMWATMNILSLFIALFHNTEVKRQRSEHLLPSIAPHYILSVPSSPFSFFSARSWSHLPIHSFFHSFCRHSFSLLSIVLSSLISHRSCVVQQFFALCHYSFSFLFSLPFSILNWFFVICFVTVNTINNKLLTIYTCWRTTMLRFIVCFALLCVAFAEYIFFHSRSFLLLTVLEWNAISTWLSRWHNKFISSISNHFTTLLLHSCGDIVSINSKCYPAIWSNKVFRQYVDHFHRMNKNRTAMIECIELTFPVIASYFCCPSKNTAHHKHTLTVSIWQTFMK